MAYNDLNDKLAKDQRSREKAEREKSSLMQAARVLGVLGFLWVVPVVCGAYLGRWIDSLYEGYSVRWTVSLIILGVVVGSVNVYLSLRE